MRTAIVSDLHLGSVSGEDVARDAAIRRALLEGVAAADRLVLLGDVVELREQPLGAALAAARPFFEELGEALAGREVVLVPGNHDHRFAEPLLDELSLAGGPALGLEHRFDPSPGPTAQIGRWLDGARLSLAYPGIWLREDVYATHGHYMDCHMTLPRIECLAAAALMRIFGKVPDPAGPGNYERVLQPIYGLTNGLVQTEVAGSNVIRRTRPSELAWRTISGRDHINSRARRIAIRAAIGVGIPASVWTLNRLLRSSFDADFSATAITRAGLDAATELAQRLGVDSAHAITGHTHRGGPYEGEGEWPLPGGGRLHNTGSWVFATAFHHPGRPPSPYWPGTVTWVEGSGAPRRVQLLRDRSHAELTETVALSLAAAPATPR